MKKVLITMAMLTGLVTGGMMFSSFTITNQKEATPSNVVSQGPKFAGLTFESRDGETLDFYADKVVYHAKGANVSRRGDYRIGGISNVAHAVGQEHRYITIDIYVGERTVTLKGSFTYKTGNGEVIALTLYGQKWSRW